MFSPEKTSFKVHSFKNSCRNQIPDTMKHFGCRKIQLSLSIYDKFFFYRKRKVWFMFHSTIEAYAITIYDTCVCYTALTNIRYARMIYSFDKNTVRGYDTHPFNKNTVRPYDTLL